MRLISLIPLNSERYLYKEILMFCNRNLDQVVLNCLTYLLQFLKRTIKWIYEVEIRMESRVSRKKGLKEMVYEIYVFEYQI